MSSMDLDQIKRERDNALQQPMPSHQQANMAMPPSQGLGQGDQSAPMHDDDKNPEIINSILNNYNGNANRQMPPQQGGQVQSQEDEEPEMDLRENMETMEENAEEFQIGGGGVEMQYKYFNYMNEIKKVVLIMVLVLLFNNPLADKFIYRYVKKFIFTGESLNWIGYVVKALLIGVLFFAISHFLLAI